MSHIGSPFLGGYSPPATPVQVEPHGKTLQQEIRDAYTDMVRILGLGVGGEVEVPAYSVDSGSFFTVTLPRVERKVEETVVTIRGSVTTDNDAFFDWELDDLAKMNLPPGRKMKGYNRDPKRLLPLVEKGKEIVRAGRSPSVVPCGMQLSDHYVRRPDKAPEDFPLARGLTEKLRGLDYCFASSLHLDYLEFASKRGTRTWHDPSTGDNRMMHYQHPRITRLPVDFERAMSLASMVLRKKWFDLLGGRVPPRPFTQVTREQVAKLCTPGSAGEYSFFGIKSRDSDEFIDIATDYLQGFVEVATQIKNGSDPNYKRLMIETLVPTFLKAESRLRKVSQDGSLAEPDARIIFNVSPLSYVLSKFLFGPLFDRLIEEDPSFGPGYGIARGNDKGVLGMLERVFPGKDVKSTWDLVMADIEKWDANFCERHIEVTQDTAEGAFVKFEPGSVDFIARELALEVHIRTLVTKAVAHPCGVVAWFVGSMPSGHAQTSNFNTVGNSMLPLVDAIMKLGDEIPEWAMDTLADASLRSVRTMGDNQIFSTDFYADLGVKFDLGSYTRTLAALGLKLSPDESVVSPYLQDVGFCSRKFLKGPASKRSGRNYIYSIRTHSAIVSKLASFPKLSHPEQVLYTRSLKMEVMGEPVMHELLSMVEDDLGRDSYTREYPKKAMAKALEELAQKMYGDKGPGYHDDLRGYLMGGDLSRESCLSLQLDEGVRGVKQGTEFVMGAAPADEILAAVTEDDRLNTFLQLNRTNFMPFLIKTGQWRSVEMLDDMDTILNGTWRAGLASAPPVV
jgi:hypothetical protein